jgi:HK97 gp10 family phage protein
MEEVVKGGKALKKALEELEKKVMRKILRTELRKAAKEMADDLKAAVPVGDANDPHSGELKREVKVRAGKRSTKGISMTASIQAPDPSKFYGPWVELGSKKQHAQHFGEKAGDETLPSLANSLPANIWKAIQNEVGK